ncbi:hypothetical protein bsdcttw_10170 [Anaerocolumna chitinilytica]|uniref:2Fe-2S ferredoxin-type domain-containing protein n=2 Tax=Anaerocolumna chitinilytica TaxID=1727145 RepID=A0A7I8DNW2_9FIRM|nr:hypothetical protein bsdcttw_10170 [Anaerocolumna chitinilytica]
MVISMEIIFLPFNKKLVTEKSISLQKAAFDLGIDTGALCGGKKTCGKCKVLVSKGNNRIFSAEENLYLTEEEKDRGVRLACCFYPTSDTCVILDNGYSERNGEEEIVVKKDTFTKGVYGAAIDIGTTNIEGMLYDRKLGNPLVTKGLSNPQKLYGADVVSRITYALEGNEHSEKLQETVRKAIQLLLEELSRQAGILMSQIDRVVLAGNTTMTNLFLGQSVMGLSRAPFQSESYSGEFLEPQTAGFHINPEGLVYVMPGISGHVGGDALACILSKDLQKETRKILLLDIGTNAELILCDGEKLIACSVAAGPAFEGGNISCGMRAEAGAIISAVYKEESLEVEFIREGDKITSPKGICGSGLIECIYELYKNGKIDETGRLLGRAGEENLYRLWRKAGKEVSITQKDIREFQLAQGAIAAGTAMLLAKAGLEPTELDKVYLAGNFGGKLSIKKAIALGLLPPVPEDNIEYIGNGSLRGSARILMEEIMPREAEQISQRIEHIELALEPDFSELFIKAMTFPELT